MLAEDYELQSGTQFSVSCRAGDSTQYSVYQCNLLVNAHCMLCHSLCASQNFEVLARTLVPYVSDFDGKILRFPRAPSQAHAPSIMARYHSLSSKFF
jgi:hypothetical protein